MNSINEQKEEIIKRLKEINVKLTDEVIKNATKSEMEEYIELVDLITSKLEAINELENN